MYIKWVSFQQLTKIGTLSKFEVRKFIMQYTKHFAEEKRQRKTTLENHFKNFERTLDDNDDDDDDDNLSQCILNKWDVIYEGAQMRRHTN